MATSKELRREKKRQATAGRGGADSGQDAAPGAKLDKRLARAARKAEKKLRAEEKTRADAEFKARLARSKEESERTRQALAEQETAVRTREKVLSRDLPEPEEEEARGLLGRIAQGISRTRENLSAGLGRIVLGKKEIDQEVLTGLEELLISADIGMETTRRLLDAVGNRVRRDAVNDPQQLKDLLKSEISRVMSRDYPKSRLDQARPAVVLFVGVNGTGKTTTIGKIASQHTSAGRKVLLAAGDTFRAAAAEQLAGWSERAGCAIYRKAAGSDPSSVIHQAVQKAMTESYDLVLCDTAGRLHTKTNLMEELKKIKRVIGGLIPEAPHETYLVLDGNTGQNAIMQTRDFHQSIGVTGIIVSKLDGTARGGVVVGIVNEFSIPIRYIGIGEGVDDLRPFDPAMYARGLLD
ncbi:MAG: signal recognition particle-docking protein FtsY [SAR324 cluster bacterium]|nr:signal recognition particle-docking protein FtsY [SAR324 cluster bacterium]